MKNNRREFIRKSTAMAALSVAGLGYCHFRIVGSSADQRDAGKGIQIKGIYSGCRN